MEAKIREIVARVARFEEPGSLPADADLFRDVGVKSTAALELLFSLEEEFDVQIPDDSFAEARSINALVSLMGELQ